MAHPPCNCLAPLQCRGSPDHSDVDIGERSTRRILLPEESFCTCSWQRVDRSRQMDTQRHTFPLARGRLPPALTCVALCCCAQAMRTVEKNGLQATAKKAGLDLYSLPFTDARKARLEWLAKQPGHPPQSKVGTGRALVRGMLASLVRV